MCSQYWEYRLLPDFSNSQSNTTDVATPRILDAYVNAHYWDEFQVEAGKFKQPFSYEQLVQDRFIPTVERSIIDQLAPARDVGVMVHGEKLFGDNFDYAFSVFNGEINDDYDQNNGKDMAARVVVRPLNFEDACPIVCAACSSAGLLVGSGQRNDQQHDCPTRFARRIRCRS